MANLYALFGMICWGIAPIFGKVGLNAVDSITALILRTLMAGIMVCGWVFAAPNTSIKGLTPMILFFIAAEAILATLVGDLAYFVALRRGNINDVTLIMSSSPLVTMILSVIILSEKIYFYHLIGGALIILGLVLIGLQPKF